MQHPADVLATLQRRLQRTSLLAPVVIILVCFTLTAVAGLSVSSPPSKHQQMNRKARQRAMNSIWHYTQQGRPNPDKALRLLAKLLQEEADTNAQTLKQGVVWNVLRLCRQPLSEASLERLETSLSLLQNNPRLYQVNMTEFALTTLDHNGNTQHAQSILNRYTDTLLKQSDWDETLLLSAKNAIWFHLNKNLDKQQGAEKALVLLERLLKHDKNTNIITKGMVFNVLRACQRHPSSSVDGFERLVPLLKERNLLDAKIWNEVLVAMTKCKSQDAMICVEAMLKSSQTVRPNVYHYCAVLNGYAKRGDAKKAEQLLQSMTDRNIPPNTVVCNCVLDALSKSTENKVVERSEQLLKRMNQDRRTTPDMVSYTNMLNLYSKHAMGEKAEELLMRLLEFEDEGKLKGRLSERNYRCVIDALAKSGHAERAERLVERMAERNVMPNMFHYCGVLNGYAREGKPLEAERLMLEMSENPNVVAFNCAMYAWAKSGEVDAPFRAKALLDHMIEKGVSPNLITYNCLLSACANRSMPNESEKLLKHMNRLHDSGELDVAPNIISYNYVLGE